MRFIRDTMKQLAALLTLLVTSPANACNLNLVELLSWSIAAEDSDTNRLDTSFRFNGTSAIRMIDASVGFSDILGGRIASFAMDRDVSLTPGQEFALSGLWGPYTFERLLDLKAEDVTVQVCVRAVVHADGTVERFD